MVYPLPPLHCPSQSSIFSQAQVTVGHIDNLTSSASPFLPAIHPSNIITMVLQRLYHLSWLIIMALWGLFISSTSTSKQYLVGDTTWSIPPSPAYYNNWSSSILLFVGDSLLFEFESEFHNVMQVTRLDYESCTTKNPIKALISGPAIVSLMEPEVLYFICNVSNYCDLGQKVCITVHKQPASTTLSPAPSPVSSCNSSAPSTPSSPPYATIGSPSIPSNHDNSSEAPASVAVGSTGMLFMWDSMFHFWIFLLVGMIV